MKILSSLLLALLITLPLIGQTNVSGNITVNTTWGIQGSPYIVAGNVGVPTGLTLTIAPGVTVKYAGAFQIFVKGNVIAVGKKDSVITFTGTTPMVNSGATHLKFEGANLSASKVQYVTMEYAFKSIRVGEESEHNQRPKNTGTLTVDNIRATEADIITAGYETMAKLVITNGDFRSMNVLGQYPLSEPIEIRSSVFNNCMVTSDAYNYGIRIDSSRMFQTSVLSSCCGSNVSILNSLLYRCSLISGDYAPFTIENSRLIEMSFAIQNGTVDVKNSIITLGDSATATYSLNRGSFIQSQMIGAAPASGWNFHNASTMQPVTIMHSLFYRSTNGLIFTSIFDSLVTMDHNNFIEPRGYAAENRTPHTMTMANNYWGTTHPDSIAAHLFDENDDLSSGKILTHPILTEPDLLAPISPPSAVTKTLIGGTVYLSWNANKERDLAGHRLYAKNFTGYSFLSSVSAGTMTVASLPEATLSDTIGVTAYDSEADGSRDQFEGRESWYSLAENGASLGVPGIPLLRYPVDGSVGLPLSMDLRWDLTDRTERYHVQLSADSAFASLLINDLTVKTLTKEVGTLSANTRYYWRVRSLNPQLAGSFSQTNSFVTLSAPAAPELSLPLNGANIGQDEIRFAWRRSSPHETSYRLEVGTDSSFVSGMSLIDSTITDTSRSVLVQKQSAAITYWWRVRGRNEAGSGPFSTPRSFLRLTTTVPGASSPLPSKYALLQNFPNPFNPVTSISYDIPLRSHVTLTVYSLLGESVGMPVRMMQEAGRYTVPFDGTGLSSGIYFYRLQAGSFIRTGRMVLTK